MKSTWFGDRRRYEFARLIADADDAANAHTTFEAWLRVACGALRQAVYQLQHGGEQNAALEADVVRAQQSLRHPEKLTEAFGVLVAALEDDAYDFLGTTLGELQLLNKQWKGQCFTPPSLCRMLAEMSLGERSPDPEHRLTICEPCCGGGAIAIAAAEHLKSRGFYPWNYWLQCADIDWRCFAMTYIQLTLLGVPAVVVHGNSLSMEVTDHAVTLVGVWHPLRRSRNDTTAPETVTVTAEFKPPTTQRLLFSA